MVETCDHVLVESALVFEYVQSIFLAISILNQLFLVLVLLERVAALFTLSFRIDLQHLKITHFAYRLICYEKDETRVVVRQEGGENDQFVATELLFRLDVDA